VAKAGTQNFHGTGYLYARHHSLNSNDWLNNRVGAPKPANKYFFPGGNIGGPLVLPGTNINKNRHKLFFFTGYEHFFQTLDTGLLRATVPTEGIRNGNFTDSELRKIEGLVNGQYINHVVGRARAAPQTGAVPEWDRSSRNDRSGRSGTNEPLASTERRSWYDERFQLRPADQFRSERHAVDEPRGLQHQ
jgi:hypothetical protein